jgi:mono/diheme cytochrome c family protein
MKRNFLIAGAMLVMMPVIFIACKESAAGEDKKSIAMSKQELVARGSYLVNSIGCDDCHSPKKFGPNGPALIPELRLSGYNASQPILPVETNVIKNGWTLIGMDLTTAVGPWGQSFASNLTPDGTGIGNWKEEQFIKAIREGKYKGLDNTRPLLPPMPWVAYKNLTDDDLKSIFAYLKSLPPVKNAVPAPIAFSELK